MGARGKFICNCKYKNCCDMFGRALKCSQAIDPDYNGRGEVEAYYIYDRGGLLETSIDYCPFCGAKLPKENHDREA